MYEALQQAGGDPSGWYVPAWSLELDKTITAATGVKTAILSITAPGPVIVEDPVKAATLARECNKYVAALRDNDPSSFGFFASLPSLLDTQACLNEISYALDTLGADGVTLYSRYGSDNHYLGHPDLWPVWAELSRRKAVVFIHPTYAVDTHLVDSSLPQPMSDYPHETGRTAMDLIVSGVLLSYPGCKVILSHAGGTLPYLIYRAAEMLPLTPSSIGRSTEEILEEACGFYFDTAISSSPVTLKALFEFAKPGHVLFGTDFPNAPSPGIQKFTQLLEEYQMPEETRRQVDNEAALAILPRLRPYFESARGSKGT